VVSLFAFLVMALTAFEQGRIIANQRLLIQDLYRDSLELNAARTARSMGNLHR
jgi:hypothetical protein